MVFTAPGSGVLLLNTIVPPVGTAVGPAGAPGLSVLPQLFQLLPLCPGAGVGVGYVLPLSRNGHWRLEFGLQAGFFGCKYDPYQYESPIEGDPHDDLYYYKYYGDPSLFKERQHRFTWLGPTRVGISLSYDLLYRRIAKKGVSFIPWEDMVE